MCHPGGYRSGILAVHKRDIPGFGTILVEEDSPSVGPSESWLGHRHNIPSWLEVVDHYLAWVVGTGYLLTKNGSDGCPASWNFEVVSGCDHVPSWVDHCSHDLLVAVVDFWTLWLEPTCWWMPH